jgi:hypothetical protein
MGCLMHMVLQDAPQVLQDAPQLLPLLLLISIMMLLLLLSAGNTKCPLSVTSPCTCKPK